MPVLPTKDQTQKLPHTFVIRSPRHLFAKLHWELAELRARMRPSDDVFGASPVTYAAFNFAVTAWHLSDWVSASEDDDRLLQLIRQLDPSEAARVAMLNRKSKRWGFQVALMKRYDCLRICHDLANGDKHAGLGNPQAPLLTATVKHEPVRDADNFLCGYSLVLNDGGSELDGVDFFKDVIRTWRDLLGTWGIIEDPLFTTIALMQDGKDDFGDPLPDTPTGGG